jgi:carbon storage regulator CsrA
VVDEKATGELGCTERFTKAERSQQMLVVTRKIGQEILIPDANIRIQITGVNANGAVRVGIEAPKSTSIVRAEITSKREVQQ